MSDPYKFFGVPPNVAARRFVPWMVLTLCVVLPFGTQLPGDETAASMGARITTSFDPDWLFLKGDATDAEKPEFDDTAWRALSVPHDWSIEGPFDEDNPTGGAGGFLPAGVGWYRKHFTLPADDAQRRVFIDFDGVMSNSDVWINGFHLGQRPNGYVSFRYELTGHLNFGDKSPNVLAVRADNSNQPASRWYAGAGIYRHVRLVATDPVHLDQWSTYVTTPEITPDHATVHVANTVVNQSDTASTVSVKTTIIEPDGKAVQTAEAPAQNIAAGASVDFQQDLTVAKPEIWDLDHPNLYRAVEEVCDGQKTLDDDAASFGIRQFVFSADTGFSLNGKNIKLKGVCLHHDVGGLGSAVPAAAWSRRLAALKQVGCNAIRTSHNPVAPEFLDLCDRMGFLVMDEMFDCWEVGKNTGDYHLYFKDWWQADVTNTVRRDRNHPSIVIYSAGNEIKDIKPDIEPAKAIFVPLRDLYHQLDPTRPVTLAVLRPNLNHVYDNGFAELMDVVGQNYRENELVAAHESNPERKVIGTETRHDLKYWLAMRDNAFFSGQFLWTGADYLGESHNWPGISRPTGLIDRTDAPYPKGFQRQSWWSEQPMVRIVRRTGRDALAPTDPGYDPEAANPGQVLYADWTPGNTAAHEETVEVYSNCEEVELFLNDQSLGAKPRPADDSPRTWQVSFAPGTIKAVGRNGGKAVATDERKTADKPVKVVLTIDRPKIADDWDDVSYVTASIVDANGVTMPNGSDLVTFSLSGPGVIAAVDNGDVSSHESFQGNTRHAYAGQCVAVIRASAPTGTITVSGSAPGLEGLSATIEVVAPSNAGK